MNSTENPHKKIEARRTSLLRSTSIVSLFTFLSRLMGFARDMTIASLFGAEGAMDAFFIAFKIPNFMRRLFAEGAFSQAFVPVLAEYQQTAPHQEVRQFLARIAGALNMVLGFVTIIGIIAAPFVIYLFAPGFKEEGTRFILAVDMLRITFPYLMLISLTAMAGAILNTYGYFGVPAITPIFLNITLIIAAFYFRKYFEYSVMALAWGVLCAGIIQFLFQLPFLIKRGLMVKPQLAFHDEGVSRVMKLMVPALFGVSIAQINLLVDTIFASFLQVGSISWLFYTDRLTDFPLGVFGVAIATVILPHLSKKHTHANHYEFSASLDWAMKLILLIGVPSALGLAIFAKPIIASCFGYGQFNIEDVIQTQKSLSMLALGVPAFMLVKVLASGFYAQQNIKTPVKIGAISMVVNTILCAILIMPLQHAGLTLASALAGYVNCFALLIILYRRNIYKPQAWWRTYLMQLLCANTTLSVYLMFAVGNLSVWLSMPFFQRISYLLMHIAIAGIIYITTLLITGVRPHQFRGFIRS